MRSFRSTAGQAATTDLREFRYERKFLVEDLDDHQAAALIRRHPAFFYEPYPPRYVNNLYLDTPDLAAYFDHVNGIESRAKVRIRWYGELLGEIAQPRLEFKVKQGMVGTKESYALGPFTLDEGFCHTDLRGLIARSDLPSVVRERVRGLNGVLCNRYVRRYFATRDQRFRVTLDTEMTFYQVRRLCVRFPRKFVERRAIIVELKYAQPFDRDAQRISRAFPFTLYRNSKYVMGIERVHT